MNASGLLPPSVRDDFPLLARLDSAGRTTVYLDSASTSLKPWQVIQAVTEVLEGFSANVHRSVHHLGDAATELFETARRQVARLIGAESHELIFVRNTTEALNLVARCYPRKGRVLVSLGEHHSNLLPWEGDQVRRLPPRPDGSLDEDAFLHELARGGVSVVAASYVSNVTGHRIDARRLADATHAAGAVLLFDGAQAVPHLPIDVRELGCDFLAFSSHKMCGPSGIGALYGTAEQLSKLDVFLRGGGAVEGVERGTPTARALPWRFEAGTPAIEAAVGFGVAAEYLQEIGLERIERHSSGLRRYAYDHLRELPGVKLVGPSEEGACGSLSFVVRGVPSHLIARSLSDGHRICVRSGYHCAQPLHEALRLPPTVRFSFYLYNQPWEIDQALEALGQTLALGRARV